MANFVYDISLELFGRAGLNLQEAGVDMRLALLMDATTADTERAAATVSAFTTLDEYTGTGYSRIALATQTFVGDFTNHWAAFAHAAFQWAALGAGARPCLGALYYQHVGADTANVPFLWIDEGNFPFVGLGGAAIWTPSVAGAMVLQSA